MSNPYTNNPHHKPCSTWEGATHHDGCQCTMERVWTEGYAARNAEVVAMIRRLAARPQWVRRSSRGLPWVLQNIANAVESGDEQVAMVSSAPNTTLADKDPMR